MKAETHNDGGQAFPTACDRLDVPRGMSLRDYFAIHAPEPTQADVEMEMKIDRQRNPHNDSYKPRIRNRAEVVAQLRYAYADSMIQARSTVVR